MTQSVILIVYNSTLLNWIDILLVVVTNSVVTWIIRVSVIYHRIDGYKSALIKHSMIWRQHCPWSQCSVKVELIVFHHTCPPHPTCQVSWLSRVCKWMWSNVTKSLLSSGKLLHYGQKTRLISCLAFLFNTLKNESVHTHTHTNFRDGWRPFILTEMRILKHSF